MYNFTLLHESNIDDINRFILYSTRSNGTHFFVGSATISRFKNSVFEIADFNFRKGFSQTLLNALLKFYHRIHAYLSAPITNPTKICLKSEFDTLFTDKAVSKIKLGINPFHRSQCLQYGYQAPKTRINLLFSTDTRRVITTIKDWLYYSSLFPADAVNTIDILEPLRK